MHLASHAFELLSLGSRRYRQEVQREQVGLAAWLG